MARKTIDEQTNEATEAETKRVLEAVSNGDPIPAGFVFDPHGKVPVRALKDADAPLATPVAAAPAAPDRSA
jgi:hypothetical protein